MCCHDYIIAHRRIRLSGAEAAAVVSMLPSLKPFSVEYDAVAQPVVEVGVGAKVCFDEDGYCLLTRFDLQDNLGECTFYGGENGYLLKIEGAAGCVMFACDRSARKFLTDACHNPSAAYVAFVRFGLWFVVNMAFALDGCSAVHSSTLVCRGEAVMFLGESGTGKSTHTRLWRENIEGVELLNDDSPFVAVRDGRVSACGSAWSGKTPCYKNECYPLRAVVRLSQAPHNRIYTLKKLQSIGALLPSLPPALLCDKALEEALLAVLSKVLQQVPVYHLECLPDAAAAQLCYNTIFGDETKCK